MNFTNSRCVCNIDITKNLDDWISHENRLVIFVLVMVEEERIEFLPKV